MATERASSWRLWRTAGSSAARGADQQRAVDAALEAEGRDPERRRRRAGRGTRRRGEAALLVGARSPRAPPRRGPRPPRAAAAGVSKPAAARSAGRGARWARRADVGEHQGEALAGQLGGAGRRAAQRGGELLARAALVGSGTAAPRPRLEPPVGVELEGRSRPSRRRPASPCRRRPRARAWSGSRSGSRRRPAPSRPRSCWRAAGRAGAGRRSACARRASARCSR